MQLAANATPCKKGFVNLGLLAAVVLFSTLNIKRDNNPRVSLVWKQNNAPEVPLVESDFHLNLTIPAKMPWITIESDDFEEASFGKASIDLFRGHWESIEAGESYSTYDYGYCPNVSASIPFMSCSIIDLPLIHPRATKEYVASGLRPFNASQFVSFFKEKGPLIFVGDSVTRQMYESFKCMLENQLGVDAAYDDFFEFHWKSIETPTPTKLAKFELRVTEWLKTVSYSAWYDPEQAWVDKIIEAKASYVVYNTGAWWAQAFRRRNDWCNWKDWSKGYPDDVVKIYEDTFRNMLLPALLKLKRHGITPIWRDVAPAGLWDDNGESVVRPDAKINPYTQDYLLNPIFNRIGRRITQEVGGLLLPIHDLSIQRGSDDIVLSGGGMDQVHWCLFYGPNAVPAVWIRLLQGILFDENGQAHPGTMPVKRESMDESSSSSIDSLGDNGDAHSTLSGPQCACSTATQFTQCIANTRCRWYTPEEAEITQGGEPSVYFGRCDDK